MNCKYHKVRSNKGIKYGYCSLNKEKCPIFGCKCNNIEYKEHKTIKKATYRHYKADKGRFSIVYPLLDKCVVCGSKCCLNKHEIFYGKNRKNSITYGLIVSLCQEHHTGNNGIHFNKELDRHWKLIAKQKFEECYPDLKFIDIFKKDYF